MAEAKKVSPTRMTTGKVRLSYAQYLFEHNDDDKFSILLLIPKSDKVTCDKIKAAIEAVKKDPKGAAKWGGKVPVNLKTPLRDGDTERDTEEFPEYKGMYFINASTKNRPNVVDLQLDPITDKAEVYSGCYGRVSLNFYAYNEDGNKGIAAGLNNVQKVADGEPLGNISRVEDDFGPMSEEEFAEADAGFLG